MCHDKPYPQKMRNYGCPPVRNVDHSLDKKHTFLRVALVRGAHQRHIH